MNAIVNPAFGEKVEQWLPDEPCSCRETCSDQAAIIPPSVSGFKGVKCIIFVLVALACLLSLASFGVSVMVLFGKTQSFEGCECPLQNEPQQSNIGSNVEKELQKRMEMFQKNLTALETALTSKHPGPPGPRGYNGSQGPPGNRGPAGPRGSDGSSGRATGVGLCQYKNKSIDVKSLLSQGANELSVIDETDGKRIVSVTCSTDQGAECRFRSSLESNGKQKYKCECRKTSDQPEGDQTTYCSLHYWECPLTIS